MTTADKPWVTADGVAVGPGDVVWAAMRHPIDTRIYRMTMPANCVASEVSSRCFVDRSKAAESMIEWAAEFTANLAYRVSQLANSNA